MHHKIFDLGAYTVKPDGVLVVSEHAHGTVGFDDVLMRHHGKPIRHAQRQEWLPAPASLNWHAREVFKAEAREVVGSN